MRAAIAAVLPAVVLACRPDLPVSGGARIVCADDSVCPPGLVCSRTLGRCIAAASGDEVPPAFDRPPSPMPRAGTRGTEFRLAFDVTEPLARDPEVWTDLHGRLAPWTPRAHDGLRYEYSFTLAGDESEGTSPVRVRLLDAAGNLTPPLEAGTLVVDFHAPFVVAASVALRRDPGNPLSVVTALRDGARAVVSVNTSEPVPSRPAIRGIGAGTIDVCPAGERDAPASAFVCTFDLTPADAASDGRYALVADVEDEAGNRDAAPAPDVELVIDRTPPAPVDTARLAHLRVPWGALQTGGAPGQFLVRAGLPADETPGAGELDPAAFGTETDSLAQVRAMQGPEGGPLLGVSERTESGWPAMALATADAAELWVSVVDGAGNESPRRRVAAGEWVATLGGKVAGSVLENPHRFSTRTWFAGSLDQPDEAEAPRAQGLLRADSDTVVTSGTGTWRRRGVSDRPGTRRGWSMVFAAIRGRSVLCGGGGAEVREWDGARWHLRPSVDPEGDGSPGERTGASLAWDSRRGRTVLFGGDAGDDSVWEWDGTSWAGRAPAVAPHARFGAAATFDSRRGRTVLFGGGWTASMGTGPGDDPAVWEWDGTAWTRPMPIDPEHDGNPPPPRDGALAFDVRRGVAVLAGGWGSDETVWEWDGASWVHRVPADPEGDGNPVPRAGSALVWDESRVKIMVYGGEPSDESGGQLDDAWAWDGTSWARVAEAAQGRSRPAARAWHGLARDTARHRTILFGGDLKGGGNDGTWELDAAGWQRRDGGSAPAGPPTLAEHAMAGDEARAKVVLFGGGRPGTTDVSRDTWEWDGAMWEKRTPADPEGDGDPAARAEHVLAWQPVRARTVLFGARSTTHGAETWEWDGSSWALRTPEDPGGDGNPAARRDASMAFDEARGMALLFGGRMASTVFDDTWLWDGAGWARRTVSRRPGALYGHATAFDRARDRVVLFGGQEASSDPASDSAWEWNGSAWSGRSPSSPGPDGTPLPRARHAMAWDARRRTTVLFGGTTGVPDLDDVWEWDGARWARRMPADPERDGNPLAREAHAMAWHAATGQVVLYGGSPGADETWEWDGGAEARPAHVFSAAFSAARGPDPARCTGTGACPFRSVAVTWRAGGVGHPDGHATNGAVLLAWDQGMWRQVASNAAPPGAPATLSWTTPDAASAGRLFSGTRQSLSFAVAPVAPNGVGTDVGSVASDLVEVRVKYELP